MIIVQHINVVWTKASRGGAAAATRNAVPEVRELPWLPDVPPEPAILVHIVSYDEATGFRSTENVQTTTLLQEQLKVRGIRVTVRDAIAHVIYHASSKHGAPKRRTGPREVAVLEPGTWCQVVTNGRWGGESPWGYTKEVFNIAFAPSLSRMPFTGSPATTFHDLADLW